MLWRTGIRPVALSDADAGADAGAVPDAAGVAAFPSDGIVL